MKHDGILRDPVSRAAQGLPLRAPSQKKLQAICDKFNAQYPVGTVVRYWRGVRQGEPSGTGPTNMPAQLLSGHTPVVWIDGTSGCISLTHVEPVERKP